MRKQRVADVKREQIAAGKKMVTNQKVTKTNKDKMTTREWRMNEQSKKKYMYSEIHRKNEMKKKMTWMKSELVKAWTKVSCEGERRWGGRWWWLSRWKKKWEKMKKKKKTREWRERGVNQIMNKKMKMRCEDEEKVRGKWRWINSEKINK